MPAAQTKITPKQQAVYKADFEKFDKNNNNALDGEELTEMAKFQLNDPDALQSDIDALIRKMDKNEDGKVELVEYMNSILGPGWVVLDRPGVSWEDVEPKDVPVTGKTECDMGDVVETAKQVYCEMKKCPLMVATSDEKAEAMETFWKYAKGCTVLTTKSLVGLSLAQGKSAAWERIKIAAEGAMKAGNTLVLMGGGGAADLAGIAKDTGAKEEETLQALFEASTSHEPKSYPALHLEDGDIQPDFKVLVTSKFLEEDVVDFFKWGQIPLSKCHLVVVRG